MKKIRFSFKAKVFALCIVPILFTGILLGAVAILGAMTISRTQTAKQYDVIANEVLLLEDFMDGDDGARLVTELQRIARDNEVVLSVFTNGSCYFSTNESFLGSDNKMLEIGEVLWGDFINGEEYASVVYDIGNNMYLKVSQVIWAYRTDLRNVQTNIFYIAAGCIVFCAILCTIFCAMIGKVINKITKSLQAISSGDLSVAPDEKLLNRNDEMGDIYRNSNDVKTRFTDLAKKIWHVSEDLNNITSRLHQTSEVVKDSSNGITFAVEEVAKGAQQQAEDCTNGATTMDSINSFVGKVVEHTNEVLDSSNEMDKLKNKTLDTLDVLVNQNESSVASIETMQDKLNKTHESIKNVSNNVELIQSIASQTNLLALNASIEAARSGEAGRGFAVVATEIKKLSTETSNLVDMINETIKELNTNAKETIDEMEIINEKTVEQSSIVDTTKNDVMALGEKILSTKDGVTEINNLIDTLSDNSNSMFDTISNLSAISEENAASAEECTASTAGMNETVDDLYDQIRVLKEKEVALKEAISFLKI